MELNKTEPNRTNSIEKQLLDIILCYSGIESQVYVALFQPNGHTNHNNSNRKSIQSNLICFIQLRLKWIRFDLLMTCFWMVLFDAVETFSCRVTVHCNFGLFTFGILSICTVIKLVRYRVSGRLFIENKSLVRNLPNIYQTLATLLNHFDNVETEKVLF